MSDTSEFINCPACGQEMEKIFIADIGINIDICANNCGGIFFDNKELQQCKASDNSLKEIKKIIENKNFMPVDETKTRICPVCNKPMVKTKTFGVQIDTCYTCGGIFLDNNEFEKIQEHIQKKLNKRPVQVNPNPQERINLHDFCQDALDEERKFKMFSAAVDLLARSCRRRYFRRHFF